uniref:Saposin A-type domain-containing protein n=2 Tax=Bursaphelenchus xylophilus TaxID=6326 RepID=A0A1I7SVS1_BURXY
MLVLLTFLGLTVIVHSSDIDCGRVPPSLWCLNQNLAAKCNVAEQCEAYLTKSKGQKLQLTLLYETLCIDCEEFMTGTFYHDIYLKYGSKVDFELVPYGNAEMDKQGNVKCQHGKAECEGNKYEACLIHYMPEPIPFIRCIELQLPKVEIEKAVRKCYKTFKTAPHVVDQVTHCYNGKLGDQLIKGHAERTSAIQPEKHLGVPWLLFNNVSLKSAQKYGNAFNYAIDDWYVQDKENMKLLFDTIDESPEEPKMCRNDNLRNY